MLKAITFPLPTSTDMRVSSRVVITIRLLLVAFVIARLGASPGLWLPTTIQGHRAGADTIQLRAGNQLWDFLPGKVVLAGPGHALTVEFAGGRLALPTQAAATRDPGGTTVTYAGVWPGVDVQYSVPSAGDVESIYLIRAGGDPDTIRLRYNVPVQVLSNGDLAFAFRTGVLRELAPVAWQTIDGKRVTVLVQFVALSEREVGFNLTSYDPHFALTIDPRYSWHTFYGGGLGFIQPMDMALDFEGNVYITGISDVSWDGPGPTAPLYPFQGQYDIMLLKLDRNGNYQWHAFFGSTDLDFGNAIAFDPSGNVYVSGWSAAAWDGPDATPPLHEFSGGREIMILKLDGSGAYQWHTFFGSSLANDTGTGIAIDGVAGTVYIGASSLASWNGPLDQAPLHAYAGGRDAVLMQLTSTGTYQWHTFYGSAAYDDAAGVIRLDASANIFALGYSKGAWDGPGSVSPLHAYTGGEDLLLLKLDINGSYQWHTFYGGAGDDVYGDLAFDVAGNIVASVNSSTDWNGPGATPPLHAYAGDLDLAVLKLDGNGAYQWHTFYGSSVDDYAWGLTTDENGDVYVSGDSPVSWNGPGNTPPWNPAAGAGDMVVVKLKNDGEYDWHAFFGTASYYDNGFSVVADHLGSVYFVGNSYATWGGPGGVPPLNAFAGNQNLAIIKMWTSDVGWPVPADRALTCPLPPVGMNLAVTDLLRSWSGDFDPGRVTLRLDDVDVTGETTVSETQSSPVVRASLVYQPIVALSNGLHTASLTYPVSIGPGVLSTATVSWTFTVDEAAPCGSGTDAILPLQPPGLVHPYNPKAPNLPISH